MRILRLAYFENEIDLDNTFLLSVVIENKQLFYKFCLYCYDDFPDRYFSFVILEDGKILDNDKSIHFISHPFSLDLNSKRNINALYKLLKKKYYSELEEDIFALKSKVLDIAGKISLDFDIDLVVNSDISEDDLFKMMKLEFKDWDEMDLTTRFIKYIQIIYELQNIRVFVIPFLSSFFDEPAIEIIKKEISYLGITLISIDNNNFLASSLSDKTIILDSDLCAIE